MKKSILTCSILFILVSFVFSGCKPKEKQMSIPVKLEITGEGFYQYGQDSIVLDEFFNRFSITNHEDVPITFCMMSKSWIDIQILNEDSSELSIDDGAKDIPHKVELKPGKSIIFYPDYHYNSTKRVHPVYSIRSINNKKVRIRFNLIKNESQYLNMYPTIDMDYTNENLPEPI